MFNKTFLTAFACLIFIVLAYAKLNPRMKEGDLNIYGKPLVSCCTDPITGFYRDGFCSTGPTDYGSHIVCAQVTDAFLKYSKSLGNDLMTPLPEMHFPGLKAGDKWCLCVSRWIEAKDHGVAPPLFLDACHQNVLNFVNIEVLESYSYVKQN